VLRRDQFSAADVARLRRSRNFQALYQQTPDGEPTWVIEPDDLPIYLLLPPSIGGVVVSIDAGHVPGARSSYSVIQAWRSAGGQHYLIEQFRERASPSALEDAARLLIRRHRPSFVLIEDASAGIGLVATLRRRQHPAGCEVVPITTGNRSKFVRFADVVPIIKRKAVHVPAQAAWTDPYVVELKAFPNGSSDDQADATAQFLAWSRDHGEVPTPPPRALGVMVTDGGRRMVAGRSDGASEMLRRNVLSRRR
jgi:predicted phage terminase large subunit-like protein